MTTWTDPWADSIDMAAIDACREAAWPTAAEMDPDGANTPKRRKTKPKPKIKARPLFTSIEAT